MNYNDQLLALQESVSEKRNIESKINELKAQCEEWEERVREFEEIMHSEQADVDRLEKTSLAAVFYALIGKKEDRLDKEKVEAYAAKVKYDSAVQELDLIKADLRRMEEKLRELQKCEIQYETLLKEKEDAIKAARSADAQRILLIDEQITAQKSYKKEIEEAISAGSRALDAADGVLSSLKRAEDWGTWDLFGGGLLFDMEKHSKLDEAQSRVQNLQSELRRFKTELADVTIYADLQVSIDGFLRFADYFFDGFFVDLAVMEKINNSKSNVESTKRQIESVLSKLQSMDASADQTIGKLEAEKDAVILDAKM